MQRLSVHALRYQGTAILVRRVQLSNLIVLHQHRHVSSDNSVPPAPVKDQDAAEEKSKQKEEVPWYAGKFRERLLEVEKELIEAEKRKRKKLSGSKRDDASSSSQTNHS